MMAIIWNPSKQSRASISLIPRHQSHRRPRGFQFCRFCCRLPVSILLLILSTFLIHHWSLPSDPFPYSIVSESSSKFSSFTSDYDYWKEQHAKNDIACRSVANHLQNGGRVLLYNFTRPSNGPGMASLTVNLLQIALFMEERWNRTHLVIDEELLMNYRWDDTHGLFGGYLDLKQNTCVLSKSSSPAVVFSKATVCRFWDVKCQVLEIDANPQGFMFEKARRVTKRYFLQKKPVEQQEPPQLLGDPDHDIDEESMRKLRLTRFFHDLSRYAFSKLPGLRLHPHVHRLVQQQEMFLAPKEGSAANSESMVRPLTVETISSKKGQIIMDLAFHIRRGDKVAGSRKESRTFNAQEYWDRFVSQFQKQKLDDASTAAAAAAGVLSKSKETKHQFRHCFVATDDYQVVSELQVVLQRPQSSLQLYYYNDASSTTTTTTTTTTTGAQEPVIPCQHLWTLTPPNYTSTWQDRQEILGFLAQMRVLIHAKYFVGSFSSNVGGLVALFRGGQYHGDEPKRPDMTALDYTEGNRYRHFFDSYAVDWDEWGIL